MIVCQAYKFKLKTDIKIEEGLYQFSGCCRFVRNKALAIIKDRLLSQSIDKIINQRIITRHKKSAMLPNYYDLARMLVFWKSTDEYSFLKDVHSQILQQTLKDLDVAIKSAFTRGNGIRFPKFKKKYRDKNSFRYPQGFSVKDNRVYLPKIGWVRFFKSQEIDGKIRNVTVKQYADGWYISIVTKKRVIMKPDNSDPVGIDAGVRKIVTISNGYYFKPFVAARLEKKLLKAERILDRKQHPRYRGDKTKCSNNFYKQRQKVKRVWKQITDAKYDYLHKISTAIAKNHGFVAVEKLKIKNMTGSARGTLDNHGRKVRQKTGLNRSILRQSWGIFYELLEYKLERKGGRLIRVNPQNTSLTCPACQCKDKKNRQTQESFICINCGFADNADLVGSLNILSRGLEQSGKDNPYKTLPQGMREVTPEEYACHTMRQEPEGNREELPPLELAHG